MTSFSEAVAKRDQPQEPNTVVADPRTGEIVELDNAPHEQLIAVFLAAEDYERKVKEWRTAVEDELVRRHGDKRAAEVVGDHEVDVNRGFTRVWDVDDFQAVLDELLARDLVRQEDVLGTVKLEQKVDGRKAAQLLNRVEGDALVELRRCFKWEQKGRAKVKVTPVAQLVEPDYE